MTTAFVAGATGYTGQAVVAELRRRDIAVVAHVRPGSRSLARVRLVFEAAGASVDTTEWHPGALRNTLARVQPDLVFALLGITSKGARAEKRRTGAEPSYETVDYGLTMMLAGACVAAEVAPRVVYLSSLGTGPKARGAYLQWRWKTEEALRATGLPLTIARPSFISGGDRDESRPMERVGAVVTTGVLGALGALGAKRMRRRYGARTADELARALVDAALNPDLAGVVLDSADL